MNNCLVIVAPGNSWPTYNGTSLFQFNCNYVLDNAVVPANAGNFTVSGLTFASTKAEILNAITSAAIAQVSSDWSITITASQVRILDL